MNWKCERVCIRVFKRNASLLGPPLLLDSPNTVHCKNWSEGNQTLGNNSIFKYTHMQLRWWKAAHTAGCPPIGFRIERVDSLLVYAEESADRPVRKGSWVCPTEAADP